MTEDGHVQIAALLEMFGSVIAATVAACTLIFLKFQTKRDAHEQEKRLQGNLDHEAKMIRVDMNRVQQDIHKHIHQMRDDVKLEQNRMQQDLSILRQTMSDVAIGVGYIKGKIERLTESAGPKGRA